MNTISVSHHAYERFTQRFWPCTYPEACQYILSGIVRPWVAAGASRVLRDDIEVRAVRGQVVTVLRRDNPAKGFADTSRRVRR